MLSELMKNDISAPESIVWPNGDQVWKLNGRLHREDGPAIVYSWGFQGWYFHGKRHRLDGPAEQDDLHGLSSWLVDDLHLPMIEKYLSSLSDLIDYNRIYWSVYCTPEYKPQRSSVTEAVLKLAKYHFQLTEEQAKSLGLSLELAY